MADLPFKEGAFQLLQSALLKGELDGIGESFEGSNSERSSASQALVLGLRYALFLLGDPRGNDVSTQEVELIAGRDPLADRLLCILCAVAERVAFLGFDRSALDNWLAAHARLGCDEPEMHLRLQSGCALLELMDGDLESAALHFEALKTDCRALSLADCVIDAEVGLALVALDRGAVLQALESARRASRMARTEALPHLELLAHLVLARVRRTAGMPHLSSRILVALSPLAPVPWRPWIVWEQLLAGVLPAFDVPATTPAGRAVIALRSLMDHAAAGRVEAFMQAAKQVENETCGYQGIVREFHDVALCLDMSRDISAGTRATIDWLEGISDAAPRGFHGLVHHLCGDAEQVSVVSYIFSPSRGQSRRLLSLGVQLAAAEPQAVVVERQGSQQRTHAALAMLAFTKHEWIEEEQFFADLYGFPFKRSRHRKVLNMLLHRVRTTLGEAGTLHRREGRLLLEPIASLLLWDPRCERPLEDWILATLSRRGHQTAREVAAELGVALRTVQSVLKELSDTNACVLHRSGRHITYTVEDTVFSEPTTARFHKHMIRS